MKAIFAGTFDPFTVGHLDIAKRAAAVFDSVVIAVARQTDKRSSDAEKRAEIAALAVKELSNVTVEIFDGLLTEYAKGKGDFVFVRGIRSTIDCEYERELDGVYKSLGKTDGVVFFAKPEYAHISSSAVRSLAMLNAPLKGYVAECTENAIRELYKTNQR